jgi:hypothetical protein
VPQCWATSGAKQRHQGQGVLVYTEKNVTSAGERQEIFFNKLSIS